MASRSGPMYWKAGFFIPLASVTWTFWINCKLCKIFAISYSLRILVFITASGRIPWITRAAKSKLIFAFFWKSQNMNCKQTANKIVNKLRTSGAIRNNIRNFWQATPTEVLRSIGLGLGPPELEVGDKDGENGEIPLGVPQPFGDKNSGELA